MTPHTPQKPTFQEVQNPFFNKQALGFFILVFIEFFVACGQKKVESKVVDRQGDRNTMQYFLDTAMFVLNQNKSLQDTSYHYGIVKVDIVSQNYDRFAFISIHGEAIENDSIVFSNSLYVAYLHVDKWVLKDSILLDEMAMYLPDTIRKEDVNFDNQKDFVLVYTIKSASRSIYLYKLFIAKSKANYQIVSLYSSFSDLNISAQNKTIMTGEDGGMFGLNSKSIYCWSSDTLEEIKRLEKIILLDKQGQMIGDETREYRLKNNELVVKKELKNESDYFEKWQ